MSEPIWPRVLVSALIVTGDRVVMTRHASYWKWHLPDGDVRQGENLRNALIRSVREDLGVGVVPEPAPFLVTETIAKSGAPHYVTLHFVARPVSASETFIAAAGIEFRFFAETNVHPPTTLVSTLAALRAKPGWNV